MTGSRVPPVLVTGATGRVGRAVVDLLVDASVPVRALTHRSEAVATWPANVEVVTGDLTEPESLDAGLQGVGAVFLVWTAPPATAAAVIERLATHTRRVVFLSAPHNIEHPFFQQPNPMAVLYAEIERLIAAAGLASTIIRSGSSPRTRCCGGRPRFAATVSCGGPTAPPRRRPSMTATWLPSRRELSIRMDMSEAITSSRAPSH
jgi:NAD(P)-dependent dehydrogenase (short-subunit alcohol dehydrogenase family)